MGAMEPEIATVARTYCEIIERCRDSDGQWLVEVASLLPRLHAAVATLKSGNGHKRLGMMVDLDARFELYTHLRQMLGERDSYWMEFDVAGDGQAMSGSLADDLTDIYCELKHSLRLMDGSPEEAIEGLYQGFRVHWGQHLLDAERHLYSLTARGDLP